MKVQFPTLSGPHCLIVWQTFNDGTKAVLAKSQKSLFQSFKSILEEEFGSYTTLTADHTKIVYCAQIEICDISERAAKKLEQLLDEQNENGLKYEAAHTLCDLHEVGEVLINFWCEKFEELYPREDGTDDWTPNTPKDHYSCKNCVNGVKNDFLIDFVNKNREQLSIKEEHPSDKFRAAQREKFQTTKAKPAPDEKELFWVSDSGFHGVNIDSEFGLVHLEYLIPYFIFYKVRKIDQAPLLKMKKELFDFYAKKCIENEKKKKEAMEKRKKQEAAELKNKLRF